MTEVGLSQRFLVRRTSNLCIYSRRFKCQTSLSMISLTCRSTRQKPSSSHHFPSHRSTNSTSPDQCELYSQSRYLSAWFDLTPRNSGLPAFGGVLGFVGGVKHSREEQTTTDESRELSQMNISYNVSGFLFLFFSPYFSTFADYFSFLASRCDWMNIASRSRSNAKMRWKRLRKRTRRTVFSNSLVRHSVNFLRYELIMLTLLQANTSAPKSN